MKIKAADFYLAFILISFLCWGFIFKPYYDQKKQLTGDAKTYYEHTEFFVSNLSSGIYPTWNPFWNSGTPNEFFLRRIGDFNPAYFLLIVLTKVGVSFPRAYVVFLYSYYLLGLLGFYVLSKLLFKKYVYAYMSCLLLMFSSLSLMLFSSFIHLVYVPMVWFFVFILKFYKTPDRASFFGFIYCLMILSSTYIPFYFITIFLIYMILVLCLYLKSFLSFLKKLREFISRNKVFILINVLMLVIAMLPGILFYLSQRNPDIVLTSRNFNAPVKDVFATAMQKTKFGGIIPHLLIKEMFSGLDNISSSQVFISFLVYPLLLLSLFIKLSKKMVLLFSLGFFVFIMSIYEGSVYKFLFKYFLLFKYIRNFQFFFWLVCLPVVVLLSVEHLSSFNSSSFNLSKLQKKGLMLFVHGIFLLFLLMIKHDVPVSYATVFLSAVLCIFIFDFVPRYKILFKHKTINRIILLLLISFSVVFQPSYVFKKFILSTKAANFIKPDAKTDLNFYYFDANIEQKIKSKKKNIFNGNFIEPKPYAIYIGTNNYDKLARNINEVVLNDYLVSKFVLYDEAKQYDDFNDLKVLAESMYAKKNIAWLGQDFKFMNLNKKDQFEIVGVNSPGFQVVDFTSNSIKLKTNFGEDKFIVYNDNYNDSWLCFLNSKKIKIYSANGSFKGIFIPKGINVIEFYYGEISKYFLKYFVMTMFYVSFIYLLLLNFNIKLYGYGEK